MSASNPSTGEDEEDEQKLKAMLGNLGRPCLQMKSKESSGEVAQW